MVAWAKCLGVTVLVLNALQCVAGHMQLFSPIPRGDSRLKGYGEVGKDINAPLFGNGGAKYPGERPCRYNTAGPPTAEYTAGKNFTVEFMQGSPHMGGHCQFAISYDNGKQWVVLKTIVDLCFQGLAPYTYSVPLPKGARNGKALFAWSWINAGGNNEYYQNCADIEIRGGSDEGSLTGPELLVARFPGTAKIANWANTDGKRDGKEYFPARKQITIPAGAQPTAEGTVVGEACNGQWGDVYVPTTIPWDKFVNSKFAKNGKLRTDLGDDGKSLKGFFIATSSNPRGGGANVTNVAAITA